jgi:hypothetical protein
MVKWPSLGSTLCKKVALLGLDHRSVYTEPIGR